MLRRRVRFTPDTSAFEQMTKILETERLILQTWAFADAEALFEIMSDAEVARYIGDGKPFSREKVSEFLNWAENYQRENGFCRWKVIEKSSGEIIGSCGFARPHGTSEIELGYLFAKKYWGRGFATEAARAALAYGFEKLNFAEIIALTDLENVASQKVLEKIGLTRRGIEIFQGEESLVYLAKNHNNL
jgi:[ribosomal protein S5]-alanine N-acetyltransferase